MAPSPPARVTAVDTYDIRFPTSREPDDSDAMNPDRDYSAAYVVLRTDAADGHEGHGFSFTIGRGNDVRVAAIEAPRGHVVGRPVVALCADPGALSRDPVGDSRLRRLGPEKDTAPTAPGFSAALRPGSIARYTFPDGAFWAADLAERTRKGQPA
jgi:L-fuconate dehydratase